MKCSCGGNILFNEEVFYCRKCGKVLEDNEGWSYEEIPL